jgi:Fur family transcriptional regulator, ferric uptake regulator
MVVGLLVDRTRRGTCQSSNLSVSLRILLWGGALLLDRRMASGAAGSRGGGSKKKEVDFEEIKGPLRAFLREKGLHESKVRDVIVDTFLAADEHLGLEAILEKSRRKNPSVSFATVYRTMRLLVDAGVAQARDFGGTTVYEVAHGRSHHDHLICERCGMVVEFVHDQIEQLQEKVARKHGFQLRRHRHELFGLCPRCLVQES